MQSSVSFLLLEVRDRLLPLFLSGMGIVSEDFDSCYVCKKRRVVRVTETPVKTRKNDAPNTACNKFFAEARAQIELSCIRDPNSVHATTHIFKCESRNTEYQCCVLFDHNRRIVVVVLVVVNNSGTNHITSILVSSLVVVVVVVVVV